MDAKLDEALQSEEAARFPNSVRSKVDGVTVDPVNYTVTEGSTIITFKPEYLKSLSAGNHSLQLVWTDGT